MAFNFAGKTKVPPNNPSSVGSAQTYPKAVQHFDTGGEIARDKAESLNRTMEDAAKTDFKNYGDPAESPLLFHRKGGKVGW